MTTFHAGEKTHQPVPGMEQGRGETASASPGAGGVTPDQPVEEKAREGRPAVFVLDKYGFPRLRLPRQKTFFGYQTGDLARAIVPTGKKAGTHTGRIAVRAIGSFNIRTSHGLVQGIHHGTSASSNGQTATPTPPDPRDSIPKRCCGARRRRAEG